MHADDEDDQQTRKVCMECQTARRGAMVARSGGMAKLDEGQAKQTGCQARVLLLATMAPCLLGLTLVRLARLPLRATEAWRLLGTLHAYDEDD